MYSEFTKITEKCCYCQVYGDSFAVSGVMCGVRTADTSPTHLPDFNIIKLFLFNNTIPQKNHLAQHQAPRKATKAIRT